MKYNYLMNYWLVKTEPEEYSFDDLVKEGKVIWDGVKIIRQETI